VITVGALVGEGVDTKGAIGCGDCVGIEAQFDSPNASIVDPTFDDHEPPTS